MRRYKDTSTVIKSLRLRMHMDSGILWFHSGDRITKRLLNIWINLRIES
jgi:hypothetical protein